MVFIAKFRKYRIWLRPKRTGHDASGGRYVTDEGIVCRFDDHRFETHDTEIIGLLKKNPRFGIDFTSEEQEQGAGISEEGQQILDQQNQADDTIATACPFCSQKFETKAAMKAHVRAKHKEQ